MGAVALTGADTVSLGPAGAALRIFSDFADGDVNVLDFPNNLVEAKTGKNQNTIFAFNATGKVCTLEMRVLRASTDDKYMNAEMNAYLLDPPSYVLLEGEFIKRVGDGQGNISNDIYRVTGGTIQKFPNAKDNVEGDTESAVTIWKVIFANTDRAIA